MTICLTDQRNASKESDYVDDGQIDWLRSPRTDKYDRQLRKRRKAKSGKPAERPGITNDPKTQKLKLCLACK